MIAAMTPGMAGPRTALGDSIGLAIKMFRESEAPEKALVLLTDGNDTASRMAPDQAADIAAADGVVIHTVAIGDMKANGEDKVDVATLQKIAETTRGRYFFGADEAQLKEIYATLDRITPENQKMLSWRPVRELFFIPLGVAQCLLIAYLAAMFAVATVNRRRGRRETAEASA
jgi:Ca-activated chloride channel family protein